jgi:hypothetical protein
MSDGFDNIVILCRGVQENNRDDIEFIDDTYCLEEGPRFPDGSFTLAEHLDRQEYEKWKKRRNEFRAELDKIWGIYNKIGIGNNPDRDKILSCMEWDVSEMLEYLDEAT